MEIAFVSGKGGVGKSTLAYVVASALADVGKHVAIRDLDEQRSLTSWVVSTGTCAVEEPGQVYDCVIVDTPPNLKDGGVLETIASADRIVIPCTPSPADLIPAKATALLVTQRMKTGAVARIAFNTVVPNTSLARNLTDLSDQLGLPTFTTTVSRRQCFQHALLQGWRALDPRAKEESLKLAIEILSASFGYNDSRFLITNEAP